ncbi:MAG: hypothetical protein LBV08_11465, partial [Clostridiales bacterium]|nr:hypothetical protein [Clostridiales bacterium]
MKFLKEAEMKQIYLGGTENYSVFHKRGSGENLLKAEADKEFEKYISNRAKKTKLSEDKFIYRNKEVKDTVNGIKKKRALYNGEEEILDIRYRTKKNINKFFFEAVSIYKEKNINAGPDIMNMNINFIDEDFIKGFEEQKNGKAVEELFEIDLCKGEAYLEVSGLLMAAFKNGDDIDTFKNTLCGKLT